jgi:uncharacterized membrane protein YagU involved in acid resistance
MFFAYFCLAVALWCAVDVVLGAVQGKLFTVVFNTILFALNAAAAHSYFVGKA